MERTGATADGKMQLEKDGLDLLDATDELLSSFTDGQFTGKNLYRLIRNVWYLTQDFVDLSLELTNSKSDGCDKETQMSKITHDAIERVLESGDIEDLAEVAGSHWNKDLYSKADVRKGL